MGRTVWIYFVQQGAEGAIKIGRTARLRQRFTTLAASSGQPLRLLHAYQASDADEPRLHEEFASDRLHGEWFRPSRRLLDRIHALWVGGNLLREAASEALAPVPGRGGCVRVDDILSPIGWTRPDL